MNLKNRAAQGTAIAISLVMMSVVAQAAPAINVTTEVAANARAVIAETDLATNTDQTAGVIIALNQVEENAMNSIEVAAASIQQTTSNFVAVAEETEPALTEEEILWQNRLMADVNEFLNVRATADENAQIVGKLYKGDVADIVEPGETWTHITSGNVDGYVNNSYCVLGLDALSYAKANFDTEAEVLENGLRIRSEANEEASIITAVSAGTTLKVDMSAATSEEWVPVVYGGSTRYISAEYVSLSLALGEGITIEEEQEELARIAAEEAAAKAAQVTEVTTVQNEAVAATVDDVTLLAAIIQCEAGSEVYEGQVAVGAVVMNRVRSGGYPATIYEVIYQRGQFPPAGSGSVARIIAKGPKDTCLLAAQEALNGTDNTGGAMHFKRASSGHAGVVIGNHVFY